MARRALAIFRGFPRIILQRAACGYEPTREAAMAAFAKSWRRS